MITIANIRQVKPDNYDEIWAIVRSLKNASPYLKQIKELSPSWSLFKTYLNLRNEGQWNQNTFNTIYKPNFIAQIENDVFAQNRLNELIMKHNNGKSIALVCFCTNVNLCHRSIICDILNDKGIICNVL